MNIQIKEHSKGIDINFPQGLYLCFRKDNDYVRGITDAKIDNVLLRNPEHPIRPLIKTTNGGRYKSCRYVNYEIEKDEGKIVIHTLLSGNKAGVTDKLDWILMPREVKINNSIYRGFSYSYKFSSEMNRVEQVIDRTTWEIGGEAFGNIVTRYNQSNHSEEVIKTGIDFFANEWGRFTGRQCFDYQMNNEGGLVIYFEEVQPIKSGIFSPLDSNRLFHLDIIPLPQSKDIATPLKTVLFSEHKGFDEWTNIQDYLQDKYCSCYSMRRETPLPTLNISRDFYDNSSEISFRKVADKLLPDAAEMGFKRMYIGPIWWDGLPGRHGCSVALLEIQRFGGEKGLKVLCHKAHNLGIEIIAWAPASYLANDSPLLKEHPDWIIDGESSFSGLTCIRWTPEYQDYFLRRAKSIRDHTGLDGLWLDSFSHAFEAREPSDITPQADGFLKVVSELQRYGYIIYSEAMSPFGLSSAEMHLGNLAREKGHEHYAYGTSRYYIGPPNPIDFPGRVPLEKVDFFKYYANKAAMILDYDRIKENRKIEFNLKKLNHCYNRIIDFMEKRHLLSKDRGVEWRSSKNDGLILFAYTCFSYKVEKNRIVYEVRPEGLRKIGEGPLTTKPSSIYWIKSGESC